MSWNESRDCCTWDVVTCDLLTRNIISLDLSCSQLSESIQPNSSLFQLHHLQRLNLAYNDFNYSSIPNGIGWLRNLRYQFARRSVRELFLLPNLERLILGDNSFLKGVFQKIHPSNTLLELDISNTGIFGELPNSVGTLSSLNNLDLHECGFFGSIPDSNAALVLLDLSNNKIDGPSPNCFNGMRWDSLKYLNLSHNSLTRHMEQLHHPTPQYLDLKFNFLQGRLPSSFCNMSSLTFLDLSHNYFNDSIPNCLGKMVRLSALDLRRNSFTGSLLSLCAQSTSLSTIVLNGNRFEGLFLVSFLNCTGSEVLDMGNNAINDMLQIFDLFHNDFSGSLPSEVFRNFKAIIKNGTDKGDFRYMETPSYDFSYVVYEDSMSGDIPMELGQLNMLEALDLSRNWLTGKILQELTQLKFLAMLNLSQNLLVRRIPRGPQFNTFENYSYGENLGLCGPPLSKQCGTSDPSHVSHPLESDEEDDSYFASGFTWESMVIVYRCGLVVGTVM
ncbi:receptor-like protein 43 [Lycium barbarum]|uniref:receptor-like protein 43 n=1 Tax=Lycium barbarum TaxID=112863 RepID=UPI00293E0AA5|nr:receptor-like protein 43 [Lycium barbarum]